MSNQLTNPLGGRGTTGTVAKWSSPTTIGDSILTDSGTAISSSGPIRATGTSATAPAFTGSDTDTGVYFPAANQVRISTAGSLAIAVDASQNAGFGTASPQEKAQVYGNLKVGVLASGSYISLGDEATTQRLIGVFRAPGDTALSLGGYSGIAFTVGAAALGSQTERMRIDSAGNVSIGYAGGTWSSTYTGMFLNRGLSFMARDAGDAYLSANAFFDSSNAWKYVASGSVTSAQIAFQNGITVFNRAIAGTAGSALTWLESARIDATGNVGIGTASPTKKLDVNGAANITGALTVAGSVSRTSGSTAGVANGAYIVVAVPETYKALLLSSTTTSNETLSSLHLIGSDVVNCNVTVISVFQTTVANNGSAASVRITNTSGGTATIKWSFLQIS